jgi:hypothetical protein
MSVASGEAVEVAQWWLSQEISGPNSPVPDQEQQAKIQALQVPTENQIWSERGEYQYGVVPGGRQVSAHVIEFPEGGYVVVAGDDREEPVLAFDAKASFAWEGEDGAIPRILISRMLASWERQLGISKAIDPHPRWMALRQHVAAGSAPQPTATDDTEFTGPLAPTEYLLLPTPSWSQGGYYNDTLQVHVGNDNTVPVGCTATAMAMFMRYFEWPITGTGSNSYWDVCGGVNYYHSVTLGKTYDWGSMPMSSLISANSEVADLMYHAGVMVNMDYEQGGSGAWLATSVMSNNFRYRGMWDNRSTTFSAHEGPIRASIRAMVPVMLSSSSHSMVCDGYRDTVAPYYHINAGHDGSGDGWYSLATLPASDTTIDRSYPYGTPNNYAYADAAYSGTENGDLDTPYNTFGEGITGVATGGQLWLKGGTYSGIGTFSKAMRLRSHQGVATLQ